jgi:hypothetical protein
MTVNPLLPVDVMISADATSVCDGTEVFFTAMETNGGADPSYQWQVNGLNVGSNSSELSYFPQDNDEVKVILTSSEECTTNNPAISNLIIMSVFPIPEVSWPYFEPDTLCVYWEPVLLTGGLPEGGVYSGPGVANNWFNPELAGAGEHEITYTYTDNNDCSAEAFYLLFVDYCTAVGRFVSMSPSTKVYPNPTGDVLNIIFESEKSVTTIEVHNSVGRKILEIAGPFEEQYVLDVANLSNGIYLLNVLHDNHHEILKFVVNK